MSIDKYSMIHLAPSLAVIAGVVAITVFGIIFLKKQIEKDASKSGK
ncbi:MAG: hypothetical protein LRY63_11325 [Nitrincola sp.]|nr:hypothetical protein [Nitrincola sp.]